MDTLLSLSFLLLHAIIPTTGQGNECSCNITNSRCDESGVCRCDPGWRGTQCDVCEPMPGCVHGSCLQPWQCRCHQGWGGRFCDKDLSACSQQPCLNGATCLMEDSGDLTCFCPQGYHGNRCQLKTGPCHQRRSPCLNGGLCDDSDGFSSELRCRCLAGFSGRRCETNVNDCEMQPCANGATCLDGVNRFSCVCAPGFTGRFCSVNLDDCASRPCLNNARCVDRAAGFRCICRPGFTGTTCQIALRAGALPSPGGGASPQMTTASLNASRPNDGRFRVTVSERGSGMLSPLQLAVVLTLGAATLGAIALTATLLLHGHCSGTRPVTSSPQNEVQISFLNVTEPEKKKQNMEVI